MRRIVGVLLLILDISMIPAFIMYYVLFLLDLICGCISAKSDIKTEIRDYHEIVSVTIKSRIDDHIDRIVGA